MNTWGHCRTPMHNGINPRQRQTPIRHLIRTRHNRDGSLLVLRSCLDQQSSTRSRPTRSMLGDRPHSLQCRHIIVRPLSLTGCRNSPLHNSHTMHIQRNNHIRATGHTRMGAIQGSIPMRPISSIRGIMAIRLTVIHTRCSRLLPNATATSLECRLRRLSGLF